MQAQEPDGVGDDDEEVAQDFDGRSEDLGKNIIGDDRQAYPSVSRVQDHFLVVTDALNQPQVPAPPLPAEHGEAVRHLGPADGIGDEHDTVRLLFFSHVPVEADHHFHVFRHISDLEAARLHHRGLVKERKRTGQDQERVQGVPSHPSEEKSPDVFDDLEQNEWFFRKVDFPDRNLVFKMDAVNHADNAPARDHRDPALQQGGHDPQKGVPFQKRIRVDRTEIRRAGYIYAAVKCVGLTPVLFVDDKEIGRLDVGVKSSDGFGLENRPVHTIDLLQIICLDHRLERSIARTVVDDDYFKKRIVGRKRGMDAPEDDILFVMYGNKDRDGRRFRRSMELLTRRIGQPAYVAQYRKKGKRQQ